MLTGLRSGVRFKPRTAMLSVASETISSAKSQQSPVVYRYDRFKPVPAAYSSCLAALDSLISNAATIQTSIQERDVNAGLNISKTANFLETLGVSLDDLDSLKAIHISGTKGKGSTCALVDSILRQHGLKTGLFSSPHLASPRERIRLNGVPLSEEKFALYFSSVFNHLKDNCDSMPAYFKFLTVMAFQVFLVEKVDVAIVEVGIGGQYDCTNILRRPIVTAVTSLGFDHQNMLGDTIEKITWHKAGIFKPQVPALTIGEQPEAALSVLKQRALERETSLRICPELSEYTSEKPVDIALDGSVQKVNAALAIAVTDTWLDRVQASRKPQALTISEEQLHGLKTCRWPGRFQTIRYKQISHSLDGAHTPESILICSQWFQRLVTNGEPVMKVLVFNLTGLRDPVELLKPLVGLGFDKILFTPNTDFASENGLKAVGENRLAWSRLSDVSSNVHQLDGISDTFNFVTSLSTLHPAQAVHVLVTGSLHLVGGWLSLLDSQAVDTGL